MDIIRKNNFLKLLMILIPAFLISTIIVSYNKILVSLYFLSFFIVLYFYIFKNFSFWQRNIIILLSGYFILTRGFSYIGFRIGSFYIFIGEIIIFLSLIFYNLKPAINKLFKHAISKWLIIWISLGFFLVLVNIPKYRLISIVRDYAIVYYSIFALFGYAFYRNYKNLAIFYKILGWVFILHTIWGLCFPFKNTITIISPKLLGIMPLFTYRTDADGVIFMGGVLYCLLLAKQYKWSKLLIFLLAAIQFALLLIFKSRATYVGSFLVFSSLIIMNKKKSLLKILMIIVLFFGLTTIFNLQLQIRKTSSVITSTNIADRFLSIFKPEQSGTASFRLLWWRTLISDGLHYPKLLFFGRGFGPSLGITSYVEVGDEERRDEEIKGLAKSPHNILITMFGRMGIIGLFLWLGINYIFFSYMFRGLKISKMMGNYEVYNILIWITGFVIMIIGTSLFSVLLESPFIAIPYFFFMGLGIAIVDKLIIDYNRINNVSIVR